MSYNDPLLPLPFAAMAPRPMVLPRVTAVIATVEASSPGVLGGNRCCQNRLGVPVRVWPAGAGSLVCHSWTTVVYQRLGTVGVAGNPPQVPISSQFRCQFPHGQHNSGALHQLTGDVQSLRMLRISEKILVFTLHSRLILSAVYLSWVWTDWADALFSQMEEGLDWVHRPEDFQSLCRR